MITKKTNEKRNKNKLFMNWRNKLEVFFCRRVLSFRSWKILMKLIGLWLTLTLSFFSTLEIFLETPLMYGKTMYGNTIYFRDIFGHFLFQRF